MNPENFSESLAEFTLYMKKENSEIYCHCTRMTIDDRNLLFFAQDNQNGDVPWCQHWNAENPAESCSEKSSSIFSNSKEMEISHFGGEFESDNFTSVKSNIEEKPFQTNDVYVKPLVEFDDKFKEQEDQMKKMGLPLSFLGNPGAGDENKIPAFKINDNTLGMSTSSSSISMSSGNKSKKQRKKKAKNISNQSSEIPCITWQKQLTEDETNMVDKEFETYWTLNGENLVRKSWDELYGEYVVKEEDEIDSETHTSQTNLCNQFDQLDITEHGALLPSNSDNPFLALFPSGVSMEEILITTGKISQEKEEKDLIPEVNWTHLWNEHWAKVCREDYDRFLHMRTEQILDEKLIQDICSELIENVVRLQDEKSDEKQHHQQEEDSNLAVDKNKKHSYKHVGNGMAYWIQKIAQDADEDYSNQQGDSDSVENNNQQKQTTNNTNENHAAKQPETNNHAAQNNLSNANGTIIPCDDDDDEPPDEFPIVKCQKRPHENEDHDESTKQRLKNSKAAKAFADLGFTFSPPGEHLRYPDVSEIRAASVYFTSKDAVKRTKRLNINKRYTYNEDGDIVLGAKGNVKNFLNRHGGIQKAFENQEDEKSNADDDAQPSEETNKELPNDSEECKQTAVEQYVETEPEVKKYWHQRYRLFSKYDNGIVIGKSQKN